MKEGPNAYWENKVDSKLSRINGVLYGESLKLSLSQPNVQKELDSNQPVWFNLKNGSLSATNKDGNPLMKDRSPKGFANHPDMSAFAYKNAKGEIALNLKGSSRKQLQELARSKETQLKGRRIKR